MKLGQAANILVAIALITPMGPMIYRIAFEPGGASLRNFAEIILRGAHFMRKPQGHHAQPTRNGRSRDDTREQSRLNSKFMRCTPKALLRSINHFVDDVAHACDEALDYGGQGSVFQRHC